VNNLNSILIEGNLVCDGQLRNTSQGTPVLTLTIASNRFRKVGTSFEKEVSFFEVTAWGRLAEIAGAKGIKGRGVRVVGHLKQDRWVGSDGKNKSKVSIVAEHIEFRPESKKEPVSSEPLVAEDSFIEELSDALSVEEECAL